jgi:Protein of unknown function (DUF1266)
MAAPPSAPPTGRQAFALAAGAVLAEINLYGCDSLAVDPSMVATMLRRDWDIGDRVALLQMLHWLASQGHRKEFEDMGARLQRAGRAPADPLHLYRPDEFLQLPVEEQVALRERAATALELLPSHRSLIAWDFGRLIMLARWGFTVGFLSESEAWGWIEHGAAAIQPAFRSWLDVGENYLAGVRFWSQDKESLVDDTQAALDELLDPTNAKSAWSRVAYPGAAADPDVARRLEARRSARAKEHAGNIRNLIALVAIVVLGIVAGRVIGPRLHPCEGLDARLCGDLGPSACEIWKGPLKRAGSGSSMQHELRGRRGLADVALHLLLGWDFERSHEMCSMQADDAAYPATLQAIRTSVAAARR